MKIDGLPKGELEDKRVYLAGVRITDKCPGCKRTIKIDMAKHPISYPNMNKPFKYGMWCEVCGHEWSVPVILKVSLETA